MSFKTGLLSQKSEPETKEVVKWDVESKNPAEVELIGELVQSS